MGIFKNFFKKVKGNVNALYVSPTKPSMTITFGDNAWRMVFTNENGRSLIKAFSNNNLVFKGTYSELVKKLKGWE